jgi:L-rhamnose isomerase
MRALLLAMLEPAAELQRLEQGGDFTRRLALMEELKSMPSGAVWDAFCQQQGAPVGTAFLDELKQADARVLAARK